ncbi:Cwp1p KNAG_0C05690 [Huiozyma naganishii CBS 8797]|uniref:Cell wall protein CWP1 n=1 Tax=Huiozyma naganishii (strain ATCC MYA-139 / BCRC 22969 / CBS 8797 / KCTC 17520 / NBRC 10181 / NCYC 3082 / Yp74L-3) TaxID=1071383 RepID=J7RX81_HUIN7|nr:hypothetical protein KNAG_0C05690 [Kazachstania naganishii CBS 8797]CCK69667.1 hypothetical protein KNAG_0C05690 [Kazachstania naganishii CBS 8797]
MKFTSAFATIFALAQLVLADSAEFGMMSIHSGSPVHMLFFKDDNGLVLGSGGSSLSTTITDDGKLKLSNGKFVVVGSDGKFTEGAEADGSKGFAIVDSRVTYNGASSFYAAPADGSNYSVYAKDVSGSTDIVFNARGTTGAAITSYTPSGASASASGSASSTAAKATAISQIGDGQAQASVQTQTANGAQRLALGGAGAGIVAAACALIM